MCQYWGGESYFYWYPGSIYMYVLEKWVKMAENWNCLQKSAHRLSFYFSSTFYAYMKWKLMMLIALKISINKNYIYLHFMQSNRSVLVCFLLFVVMLNQLLYWINFHVVWLTWHGYFSFMFQVDLEISVTPFSLWHKSWVAVNFAQS